MGLFFYECTLRESYKERNNGNLFFLNSHKFNYNTVFVAGLCM